KTRVQLCVVHQIRSSMRYVPDRDKKAVMEDMKPIYNANNEEQGYQRLLAFEDKLAKKYPLNCKSWMYNLLNLSAFFEYDEVVRKIIYTTNPIEGVHRQIRKITKTKG
ncbi:IS256 family transposase, partial [Elizabethkingia argentiflava]